MKIEDEAIYYIRYWDSITDISQRLMGAKVKRIIRDLQDRGGFSEHNLFVAKQVKFIEVEELFE